MCLFFFFLPYVTWSIVLFGQLKQPLVVTKALVCTTNLVKEAFDYLFANLEVVVPVVDKGGEMVAETKAVQPEVEDGRVHHLKTMKQDLLLSKPCLSCLHCGSTRLLERVIENIRCNLWCGNMLNTMVWWIGKVCIFCGAVKGFWNTTLIKSDEMKQARKARSVSGDMTHCQTRGILHGSFWWIFIFKSGPSETEKQYF